MEMQEKEIVDAIKNGLHVNVQCSTGRWLHAIKISDDCGGIEGYNTYGEYRFTGIGANVDIEEIACRRVRASVCDCKKIGMCII